MGFGVWGLGFGVWGLGFGVWGLVFGVWCFGLVFGVCGLGLRVQECNLDAKGEAVLVVELILLPLPAPFAENRECVGDLVDAVNPSPKTLLRVKTAAPFAQHLCMPIGLSQTTGNPDVQGL